MKKILMILYDSFSLLCMIVFAIYLSLLVQLGIGVTWLNRALLVTTILFGLIFIFKILFLNRKLGIESSRKINSAYKVFKYLLKLLMLTTIIVGLVTVITSGNGSTGIIISTVLSNLFFLILLYFDTVRLIRRRKKAARS